MAYVNYANPFGEDELEDQYAPSEDSAFVGGLKAGATGLGTSLSNTLGAVGRIAGQDEYAAAQEAAADQSAAVAASQGHMIPHLADIDGIGGAYDWATGMIGQNVPLFGTMAAGSILGGAAGGALMRKQALAKATGRAAHKNTLAAAAKQALNRDVAEGMAAKAQQAAFDQVNKKTRLANAVSEGLGGKSVGAKVGSLVGTAAPYFTTTAGDTYSSIRHDPEAEGTPEEQAWGALGSGALQTGLGLAFEPVLGVMPRMMRAKNNVAAMAGEKVGPKAALKALGITAGLEGLTESGEQLIQQATLNKFNPNAGYDVGQLLEAGLGGALVGGAFSAPGAVATAMRQPQNTVAPAEQLQNINTTLAEADGVMLEPEQATKLLYNKAALLSENGEAIGATDEDIRAAYGQITEYMEQISSGVASMEDGPEKARARQLALPLQIAQQKLAARSETLTAEIEAGEAQASPINALAAVNLERENLTNSIAETTQTLGSAAAAPLQTRLAALDESAVRMKSNIAFETQKQADIQAAEQTLANAQDLYNRNTDPIQEMAFGSQLEQAQLELGIAKAKQNPSEQFVPHARASADVNVEAASKDELMSARNSLVSLRSDVQALNGEESGVAVQDKINALDSALESRFGTQARPNTENGSAPREQRQMPLREEGAPTLDAHSNPRVDKYNNQLLKTTTASGDTMEYSQSYQTGGKAPGHYVHVASGLPQPMVIKLPLNYEGLDRADYAATVNGVPVEGHRIRDLMYRAEADGNDVGIEALAQAASEDLADAQVQFPPRPVQEQYNIEGLIGNDPNAFSREYMGRDNPEFNAPMLQLTSADGRTLSIPTTLDGLLSGNVRYQGQQLQGDRKIKDAIVALVNDVGVPLNDATLREITTENNDIIDPEEILSMAIHIEEGGQPKISDRALLRAVEAARKDPEAAVTLENVLEQAEHRKPLPEAKLFELAQDAHEFRRVKRPRGTMHANRIGGGMYSFHVEEDTDMELRNNPTIEKYNIIPFKIKGDSFEAGFEELVRLQQADGNVFLGSMDNQVFFAKPEDRKRMYEDMEVGELLEDDINIVERIGVLTKKESGASRRFDVSQITGRHGEYTDENGVARHSHDGVIAIVNGQQLNQGVSIREVTGTRPSGDTFKYYEYDKGILRSPVVRVDANGKEIVREQQSLNKEVQLHGERTELPSGTLDEVLFLSMNPVTKQGDGTSNDQQITFGLERPDLAYLNDRVTQIQNMSAAGMLKGDQALRHKYGTPLMAMIGQEQPLGMTTKTQADTARAYVISSDETMQEQYNSFRDVPGNEQAFATAAAEFKKRAHREYVPGQDDVVLLPNTYKRINEGYNKQYGRDLVPGDLLLLHRDPALPDASSMSVFMYQGQAVLETPDHAHDRGIIVHSGSEGWKAAAGDFDGDSGVLIVPNDTLWPRVRREQPGEAEVDYMKRGGAKQESMYDMETDMLNELSDFAPIVSNELDFLDRTVTLTLESGETVKQDYLTTLAAYRANSFSQMIGKIISPGQKLAEIAALDATVYVDEFDGDRPTGGEIKTTLGVLISKIGQASISAKKKATWKRQALLAFKRVRGETAIREPYMLDPKTGKVVKQRLNGYKMSQQIKAVPMKALSEDDKRKLRAQFANNDKVTLLLSDMHINEYVPALKTGEYRFSDADLAVLNEILPYAGVRESYFSADFSALKRAAIDNSDAAKRLKATDKKDDKALQEKYPKRAQFEDNLQTFALSSKNPKGWRGVPRTKSEVWSTTKLHSDRVVEAHRREMMRALLQRGKLPKEAVPVLEAIRAELDDKSVSVAAGHRALITHMANASELDVDQNLLDKLDAIPEIDIRTPQTRTYLEKAYRVQALDRLYSELGVFGGHKFLPEFIQAAKDIADEQGISDKQRRALDAWKQRDSEIGKKKGDLDPNDDAALIEAINDERALMNSQILGAYLADRFTGAMLVAYGPQSAAGRIISIPELYDISQATSVVPTQNIQVKATNENEQPIDAANIPNGRYEIVTQGENNVRGKFALVEAYPTRDDTKTWEPGSVLLDQQVFAGSTIDSNDEHSPMSRIKVFAAQNEGEVAVRVRTHAAAGGSANIEVGAVTVKEEEYKQAAKYKVLTFTPGPHVRDNNELNKLAELTRAARDSGVVAEEISILANAEPVTVTIKPAKSTSGRGAATKEPLVIKEFKSGETKHVRMGSKDGTKHYFRIESIEPAMIENPDPDPDAVQRLFESKDSFTLTGRFLGTEKTTADAVDDKIERVFVPNTDFYARLRKATAAPMNHIYRSINLATRDESAADKYAWEAIRAYMESMDVAAAGRVANPVTLTAEQKEALVIDDAKVWHPTTRLLAELVTVRTFQKARPNATETEIKEETGVEGTTDEYFRSKLTQILVYTWNTPVAGGTVPDVAPALSPLGTPQKTARPSTETEGAAVPPLADIEARIVASRDEHDAAEVKAEARRNSPAGVAEQQQREALAAGVLPNADNILYVEGDVKLYQGSENAAETGENLWTSVKRTQKGTVTEISLPVEMVRANATTDPMRVNEFTFVNKRPRALRKEADQVDAANKEREEDALRAPLRNLDNPEQRAQLQEVAADMGHFMNLKGNVNIISAYDMYMSLIKSGTPNDAALAKSLLEHANLRADGKRGGSNGAHYIQEDGTHTIYISNALDLVEQTAVLMHEIGHGIIDESWSALKRRDPATADAILADWGKHKSNPNKGKSKAHKDGADQTDNFHEWLADRIRDWLVTEEAPRTAAGKWFASLAKRFVATFQKLVDGMSGFSRPESLDSVDTWLGSIAKSPADIARAYGAGPPGMSIRDRIEQRKTRLRNWANNDTNTNVQELNELIPDIRDNLDNLMSPDDVAMLRRAVKAPAMRDRLQFMVGANTQAAETIVRDTDTAVAYLYALTSLHVMVAPEAVRNGFATLREALIHKNRMLLEASNAETEEIIRRLNARGETVNTTDNLIPEDSPAARLYKDRAMRYQKGTMGMIERSTQAYKHLLGWYIDEPYMRIQRTGVPALIDAWEKIQPSAYELGGLHRAGSLTRSRVNYQIFVQQGTQLLKHLDEADRTALSKYMLTPPGAKKKVNDKVKKAADKMAVLFDKAYRYEYPRTKISRRANYWPMMPNHEYIDNNLGTTLDYYTAPEFIEGWYGVKEDYKKWASENMQPEDVMDTIARLDRMWEKNPRDFVRFYITSDGMRTLPGQEILQLPADQLHTPSFRFANPRELNFLLGAAKTNPELHNQVLSTLNLDPKDTVDRYFRSATKRMEHERFLSSLGPTGVKGLIRKAKEQGATDRDIRVFTDSLMATQGLLGIRERDALDKFIDARQEGSWLKQFHSGKTRIMNPDIQKAHSLVYAWENISHLTLSLAAAMIDPAGQLARHGDWATFAKSYTEARNYFKEMATGETPEGANALVQLLGTMEHTMRVQDLHSTHSADEMHQGTARVMDTFFRWNGVEKLTDWARAMSTFAAMSSIRRWHAEATNEASTPEARNNALKELHSLGLAPEDVILKDGNLHVLSFDEWAEAMDNPAEQERDMRVRAAVHTFVDQSSVRPDATSRSLFMSNPYLGIPAQWKGFSIAFSTNILKPAWAKLVEDGNATPMMWLALTGIPIMLFADIMRDGIKMAFSDDEDDEGNKQWRPTWKRGWTLEDHIGYAVKRAGLYGNEELSQDVLSPIFEGRPGQSLAELGGIAVSDARKVAKFGWDEFPLPLADLTGDWD